MRIQLLLLAVTFFTLKNQVKCICRHNDLYFRDGDMWQLDSCQACICQDASPVCHRLHCDDPVCDIQNGKALYIAANQCCPECIPSGKSCKYNGKIIADHAEWKQSKCQNCKCQNGYINCTKKQCPIIYCPPEQEIYQKPGECCGRCYLRGKSCLHNNVSYQNGEIWSPAKCTRCQCQNGEITCFMAECHPVICNQEQYLEIIEGKCCPRCVNKPCIDGKNVYKDGSVWQQNPCTSCTCQAGQTMCLLQECPNKPICNQYQTLVRRTGECCSTCVSSNTPCEWRNATFYHGDIWSSNNDCEYCACSKGLVKCRNATCQMPKCTEGKVLVHHPEKCCPECVVDFGICIVESSMFKDGDIWYPDKCRICTCQKGKVLCFKYDCTNCLNNNSIEPEDKECCPECVRDVQCALPCETCEANKEKCITCIDETKVVENGHCVEKCKPGSFVDFGRKCQACHQNCEECYGAEENKCLSCKNGKLLKNGACVANCGNGFFATERCEACHVSCASCFGPYSYQCFSCVDIEKVLQKGECVASCDAGSYVLDGKCYACNETCKKCSYDGATCWACQSGYYLYENSCLHSCPSGYFGKEGYCFACHPQCLECTDSLPSSCTKCPYNTVLLGNYCVESCGMRYYKDPVDNICQACHPSCLTCGISSSNDSCLSCNRGYLLQFSGASNGYCVENCPSKYFLTVSGICKACDKSCAECHGPNETDCTKCAENLIFKDGLCIEDCGNGYFIDGNNCTECHLSCETCHGSSYDECDSCINNVNLQAGRCHTRCKEGQYMDRKPQCRDCHPDCSMCILKPGKLTSTCLQCKQAGLHPLSDTCVKECPIHYYLSNNGRCERCHSSCATCNSHHINGCKTCNDGQVLSHDGRCLDECFLGYWYYETIGECQVCGVECIHCTVGSGCLICRDDQVLYNKECDSSCSEQFYVEHTDRTCHECNINCETCKGPNPDDCLSCFHKMYMKQGTCVPVCRNGFYANGTECLACHKHCAECSDYTECRACKPPFLLLLNECVLNCGIRRFPDKKSNKCKRCPQHCITCANANYCTHCEEGFFLKQDVCVQHCGEGYFTDVLLKKCEINEHPPSVVLNGSLLCEFNSYATVDMSFVSAHDPDTNQKDLILTLVSTPTIGRFIFFSEEGKTRILQDGSTFSLNDIFNKRLFFKHRKGEPLSGQFGIQVNDRQLYSDVEVVPIKIISHHLPIIYQVKIPQLESGNREIISDDFLAVLDADNLEEVIINIIEGPKYGKLMKFDTNEEVKNFTPYDLHNKVLVYHHDGVHNANDSIVLQAWDGYNSKLAIFTIYLKSQKQTHVPALNVNRILRVVAGDTVPITSDYLHATDVDTRDDMIIFTLFPKQNNPKEGRIIKIIAENKSIDDDWERTWNGLPLQQVSNFSQEDINKKKIWYQHSGSDNEVDLFDFEVSDNAVPPNTLKNQVMHVRILSPQDQTWMTTVPPKNLGIEVTVGHHEIITSSELSFQLEGVLPKNILYTISSPLKSGEGTLEHIDHPGVPLKTFTQSDINNGKIIYRPPNIMIDDEGNVFSFKFIISDVDDPKDTPVYGEQSFVINIKPGISEAPEFKFPDPELSLAIKPGEIIPIDNILLTVTDPDTSDDQLFLTLTTAPNNGKFLGTEGLIIEEGDSFPYVLVLNNSFYYAPENLANLQDKMVLTVSDGIHSSATTLTIKYAIVAFNGPVVLDSATLSITVEKGKSVIIQRHHLAYTDDELDDKEIFYSLISEPKHGRLELLSRNGMYVTIHRGSHFTQEHINNNQIRYTSLYQIGKIPVLDKILFNVSNSKGYGQPNQSFSVKVIPSNEKLLTVTIISDIQVQEGHSAVVGPQVFTVFGHDPLSTNLTVIIDIQPKFGYLENKKPIADSEKFFAGLPVSSFSVQDVIDLYIHYVQNNHLFREPTEDGFLFHVTDGVHSSSSSRINITIELINDEPPNLIVNQLIIEHGQAVVLQNSTLHASDLDTSPPNLIFTLDIPPRYGTLRKLQTTYQSLEQSIILNQGETFSYQDVLLGLVIYVHDGSVESEEDSYTLTVTDGDFEDTQKVEIIIMLSDRETPRMAINRGLELEAGTSKIIHNQILKAIDVDSDDEKLIYTIVEDPEFGHLIYQFGDNQEILSAYGPLNAFSQDDIDHGRIRYMHNEAHITSSTHFKFVVTDPASNTLMDQTFYITILDDQIPPVVTTNKGLVLAEGSSQAITIFHLSSTDNEKESSALLYSVVIPPQYGRLEMVGNSGKVVSEFHQYDLMAGRLLYVHISEKEDEMDEFTFMVSDGKNTATHVFHIMITPVDDSLPFVTINPLKIQEGLRKTLTEFELRAVDLDTKDTVVRFIIVKPPQHGTLYIKKNGNKLLTTNSFTMADIYRNKVSYQHDGSDTLEDSFLFTVSDGANPFYEIERKGIMEQTADPSLFTIGILPVDDGTPLLVINLGIEYLETHQAQSRAFITSKQLLTTDSDTSSKHLVYTITVPPQHGHLEKLPGIKVSSFTQLDIDQGRIYYILLDTTTKVFSDKFLFKIEDTKPNVINDNVFHIRWSYISFTSTRYSINENEGTISLKVKRTGNLRQYSIVHCETKEGTATDDKALPHDGRQDFMTYSGQVQFEEWEQEKFCTVEINDDTVYEGIEVFKVELSDPTYSLLGIQSVATVLIDDKEDEPLISFEDKIFHVHETDNYLFAPIIRTGDLSHAVSVMCVTNSITAQGTSRDHIESGSDYITRFDSDISRILFPPGVSKSTCDVKLIDDSLQEEQEDFELILSEPSSNSHLVNFTKAIVVIDGPNDVSSIYLAQKEYYFTEEVGEIEIEVIREGPDLSLSATVWCGTRPTNYQSAEPGYDYIPASMQITFGPKQTSSACHITILDDVAKPRIEGNKTFVVYLSTPAGTRLAEPSFAVVTVSDFETDVPIFQFNIDKILVEENMGKLEVTIIRQGDIFQESSIHCFTRQGTAKAGVDYIERPDADTSHVIFLPGEKSKNCVVSIIDDASFEDNETFLLKLGMATGMQNARIGSLDTIHVTITNDEDVMTIQLEKSAYSIQEPSQQDHISKMTINVIRTGDSSQLSRARVSTRDGSAVSGVDYHAKSVLVLFKPGETQKPFEVEVLYNKEREWHKMFSIIIGPSEPFNAKLGDISIATVTISDREALGSSVLPSPPIVVSLLQYDFVEENINKDPSPGYPLICVTPCDSHYPDYDVTQSLCKEAGINTSDIHFSWEVAMPSDGDASRSPFEMIEDSTIFSSAHHKVLDSIYFGRRFLIRCIAQPVTSDGHIGVPLHSSVVQIGTSNGICNSPLSISHTQLQFQSFVATLQYVNSSNQNHPNRLHIHVEIPHQDGILPLVSTYPLHNVRYLLTEPIYRQQHVCSNLLVSSSPEDKSKETSNFGFLNPFDVADHLLSALDFSKPYQFDATIREESTLLLYRHLDLKSCVWVFDAWYHMTELIDLCGGSVISDFQVRDTGQTYLTVQLPLYVSYVYSTAPTGWTSLEHRTELEFSFLYHTVLWRTGLETDSVHHATIQLLRVVINNNGRLVVEFKTQAKFRGLFVVEHHTVPDFKSCIVPPKNLVIKFILELLWSQETFDGPIQLWRATSGYNLKDYTGLYTIELIPCTVKPSQPYIPEKSPICTGHAPEKFEIPIAFQQTNRPVPIFYSLNTVFQLVNNEKIFLMNPFTSDMKLHEMDYRGSFSKGQTIYGRVLWNPEQDLESAYKLRIERLYICTGRDDYLPTFDPTGEEYGEGPQFGCIQNNRKLKHRFLILDRGNPDAVDKDFHNIPFEAKFASEEPLFKTLEQMPGVDGFLLKVDALYKVDSGHQWFLQVMYTIGSAYNRHRSRRSTFSRTEMLPKEMISTLQKMEQNLREEALNGTNMRSIFLSELEPTAPLTTSADTTIIWLVPLAILIVLGASIIFWKYYRRRRASQTCEREKRNNLRKINKNSNIQQCSDSIEQYSKQRTGTLCRITTKSVEKLNCEMTQASKTSTSFSVTVRNDFGDRPISGTEV